MSDNAWLVIVLIALFWFVARAFDLDLPAASFVDPLGFFS